MWTLVAVVAAIAATLAGASAAQCAEHATHEHFVSELYGFEDEADRGLPCMFAGTVATTREHELFYWLVQHMKGDPADAPLVIWVNGGPGASSQLANFLFHGPLRVVGDGAGVRRTNKTWAEIANVVYLDQPVGTGFSFGEPLLETMDQVTTEFTRFMQGFYALHPWTKTLPLYLTGESYGGKYLPMFTRALLDSGVQVEATLIGNPLVAPRNQRTAMHVLPTALGLLDQTQVAQVAALEKKCEESIANDPLASEEACKNITAFVEVVSANVHVYDARQFNYDFAPLEDAVVRYLSRPEVHRQLHVSHSTKTPVFEMSSARVGRALSLDNVRAYINVYEDLLARGAKMLIYAGEFDTKDGPFGQESWLRTLRFADEKAFWAQSRKIYKLASGHVGGYYRATANFSFMVVPKAGHYVPHNNYETSFSILQDYINQGSLVCHESLTSKNTEADAGCSVSASLCKALNECSGHGACDSITRGACTCDRGYALEDCSLKIERIAESQTGAIASKTIATHGIRWLGFAVESLEVSLLSEPCTFDVFIARDPAKQPTHLEHDVALRGQTKLRLNREALALPSGYRMTLRVNGLMERENLALNSTLRIFGTSAPTSTIM
ncbi:Serine carboxypeptidase-like [Hondaea fermentalgiana]|uniref:Carboxypeptidase n=1 Tax=Hondaea fermentalgiana TaxID=2315210 RepID=A0A2R5GAU5_9STRA|nr:Serine carboxypeptidase-like [Hondaea fermentalgiana]|eukprot:GBG24814.1 Serine carboxypeptidase-like [Hondaea fermentalgiana]